MKETNTEFKGPIAHASDDDKLIGEAMDKASEVGGPRVARLNKILEEIREVFADKLDGEAVIVSAIITDKDGDLCHMAAFQGGAHDVVDCLSMVKDEFESTYKAKAGEIQDGG